MFASGCVHSSEQCPEGPKITPELSKLQERKQEVELVRNVVWCQEARSADIALCPALLLLSDDSNIILNLQKRRRLVACLTAAKSLSVT